MRFNHSLIVLAAVFALANVGVATYLAASPAASLPKVVIATASSDETIPPAPPPNTADVRVERCRSFNLRVMPGLETLRVNNAVPLSEATVGAFVVTSTETGGICPTPPRPAVVNGVTLGFKWEGLGSATGSLQNIVVKTRQGQELGRYAGIPIDEAAREITIGFRSPFLSIPYGEERTVIVTADTRAVRARQGGLTNLKVSLPRLTTGLDYDQAVGELAYPFFSSRYASVNVSRSIYSPAGVQTPGQRKNLAVFQMMVSGSEPLRLNNLLVIFNDPRYTGNLQRPFVPASVSVRIEHEGGGGLIGHELGPQQPSGQNSVSFDAITPRDIVLQPNVLYSIRVMGDTTRVNSGQMLSTILFRLGFVGQNSGTVYDHLLTRPVSGNVLVF